MMIVGLTGGIGCGKSAAARMFSELGVPVVDTDQIAHELTAPGQPALGEIARLLGSESINPDGSLNRNLVRQRVFTEQALRKQLEGILHPLIRDRAVQLLAQDMSMPYQVLVVPLLFETGAYNGLIGRSLVIDCEEEFQIARTMQRSGMSEAEVRAIMAAQLPRQQRIELADDVIVNNGSLENLLAQVKEKHEKYINTCIVSQSIS